MSENIKKENKFVLDVQNLTVAYHETPVLWEINLQIPEGVRACIIGPNGSGKSTFIKSVLSLLKPLVGSVKILGEDFAKVRKKVAYIPQANSVNWDFPTTVLDVAVMGRYTSKSWLRRVDKQDKEIAIEALKEMGMNHLMNRQISQLSGGQRQRVFLARALAQKADLYFLDEPLAGVDALTEKVVMEQLKKFQQLGKTSIVVHHDLQTVREYFDYVIFINRRLIAAGPIDEIFTEYNINKCFGSKKGDIRIFEQELEDKDFLLERREN